MSILLLRPRRYRPAMAAASSVDNEVDDDFFALGVGEDDLAAAVAPEPGKDRQPFSSEAICTRSVWEVLHDAAAARTEARRGGGRFETHLDTDQDLIRQQGENATCYAVVLLNYITLKAGTCKLSLGFYVLASLVSPCLPSTLSQY